MNHQQAPRIAFASIAAITALLFTSTPLHAATLTQVTDFGSNPGNDAMYLYKPATPKAPAPIVVALHYCGGSASAYLSMVSGMASGADQYGYILIFPQTTKYNSCWDVFSTDSLTHGKGGDSASIVSMVNYVVANHGGDPERVYAMGSSSGAMMTNILLGAYPDVFKAGSAFSGVPFGCWIGADTSSGWNSNCSGGNVVMTGQQWGDLVRAADPAYTGYRGRIQLWHGEKDETINYKNFGEAIKEWTNVFGVSESPNTTEANTPQPGFTRTRYNDACGVMRVEAVSEGNKPHLLDVLSSDVIRFFALDKPGADPGPASCPPGTAGTAGNAGTPAVAGNAGSGGASNTAGIQAGAAGKLGGSAGQASGGSPGTTSEGSSELGSGGVEAGGDEAILAAAGTPVTTSEPSDSAPKIDDCLCSFAGQPSNRRVAFGMFLAAIVLSNWRRRRHAG